MLKKTTKTNGTIEVKLISKDLAKEMCLKYHYSHKWNTNFGIINFGIFRENQNRCLGVASFGNLMNPKSAVNIAKDLKQHEIIELNRLWVSDELGRNIETVFLSLCFKYIKRNHPEIKLIQSFADGRLGCGTIYKASNFKYYGYHETLFFEDISNTNTIYHKKLFEDTSRLATLAHKNLLLAKGRLRAFKVKSYRYIYILDKRTEIKLKELKYPSYEKGKKYIDDYKQTLAVMSRAYIAFMIADKKDFAKIIYEYIEKNYGKHTYEELLKISSSRYMDIFITEERYQNKLIKGINKISL